ncbi:MAG: hypothetical protein KGL46_08560 [Hyphomicrobiales bacterium]|nr:hypothetical protein [Hyphomicrobiales bacterium]
MRFVAPIFVALGFCLALTPVAFAEGADGENGRYSMTPAPDGFLRLDTRTGAVSLCKVENGSARCQAAADERSALQDEIDRLSRENARLSAAAKTAPAPTTRNGLPNQSDFNRAMDFAEQFIRRMMRVMRDAESNPDKI